MFRLWLPPRQVDLPVRIYYVYSFVVWLYKGILDPVVVIFFIYLCPFRCLTCFCLVAFVHVTRDPWCQYGDGVYDRNKSNTFRLGQFIWQLHGKNFNLSDKLGPSNISIIWFFAFFLNYIALRNSQGDIHKHITLDVLIINWFIKAHLNRSDIWIQ